MEKLKKRGNDLFIQGKYEKAITYYKKAIKHFKEDAEIYYIISGTYIKMQEAELALEYAIKSTKVDPNFAKGWHRLGISLLLLDEKEKALIAYKKSYELDPTEDLNKKLMDNLIEELNSTEEEDEEEEEVNSGIPNINFDKEKLGPFYDMLLNSEKIKEKLNDINFQQKLLSNRETPYVLFNDPDMMEIMEEFLKNMNN